MTEKNKLGLSRHIDAYTKRLIRQQCGFGCISCGSAIYQYEHIIPEFKDAKSHDPDNIGLLCGSCHDNVTRGIWSKQSIQKFRENPFAKSAKSSKLKYLLDPEEQLIIQLGNLSFSETSVIIVIDSIPILSVLPPEELGAPPQIKAQFYNRNGQKIAWIDNNEWNGSTETFDIEATGSNLKVRSEKYQIDLDIKIVPPKILEINQLNLFYNGKSIEGSKNKGFKIQSSSSTTKIGVKEQFLDKPPFGVSIQGEKIFIGSEDIVNFEKLDGSKTKLKGYYEFQGGKLDLEYGDSPYPKIQFKSDVDGGGFGIRFNLPSEDLPKRNLTIPKQERNNLCKCGSQEKYKKCCSLKEKQLNDIINDTEIIRYTDEILLKYSSTQIDYNIVFEPFKKACRLHWNQSYPIIVVNSSKSFSKNDVGYSLIAWSLIRDGYIYDFEVYTDLRHNITCDLQDILLGIPIIDKMKLDGFEMSKHFKEDVEIIKKVMKKKVSKESDNLIGGVSILESIKLLRLDYNVDYLSEDEKSGIIDYFAKKSPIAIKIYQELKQIFNPAEVYSANGYINMLLKIYGFFNFITDGKFQESIDKIKLQK